ncbi:MAG: glutamate--tRNA ligase [Planctomycetia bacterium]|nr:glutamate--tRNA ligase [Planctomycetia bacterium]
MGCVRTRFAPSPTGYLHIGGVRTALFCWLFARKHGGQFILRIDDTDQQRNVDEALSPILEGLKWLGITWDEGPEVGGPHAPYYQSQRKERYESAVKRLLESGCAYWDYATAEELAEEREAAQALKTTFVYSRRFMAESEAKRREFEAAGRVGVVRLKMPREGKLTIHDLIRGDVEFDWGMEQDHVIQRADGSCLYHLANVVDDHDLEITHVIRAEEHLSNTPRQIFIAQSLGYPLPYYAHLPFVAEPGSKTKLSKRKLDKYLKNADFAKLVQHGTEIANRVGLKTSADSFNPVIVDFYRQTGYLPEAIDNYLALLGWSLDDKSEFFKLQELVDLFSLERVNKAPASFDGTKLSAFEEKHFLGLSLEEKYGRVLRYLLGAGLLTSESWQGATFMDYPDVMDVATPVRVAGHDELSEGETRTLVMKLLEGAGDRIRVAGDILNFADFFDCDSNLKTDAEVWRKRMESDPDAAVLLGQWRQELERFSDEEFTAKNLETAMQEFLEKKQIKASKIIHALRVATTGKGVGLGMFETLEILGKRRSFERMDAALQR